jgi:serine phosphatase RsbU (regulator of sigma subunit)
MPPARKLGTRLRLALLGTAVFSLLALTAAFVPVLLGSIREDRVKLFVEQFTRALAETVSHHLEQYAQRVQETAANLALLHGTQAEELRLLNNAAREPVPTLLRHGIFDLFVVLSPDGTILFANTADRFGQPFNSTPLWGRHISEFSEEEHAFLGASSGLGKSDWYASKMVARVLPSPPSADIARRYAIALAVPIPKSNRVLLAVVNWEAVQQILDSVEPKLRQAGFPSGYAFMFARDADLIIAHKFRDPAALNNYGTRLLKDHHLPALVQAVREGKLSLHYEYPPGTKKISGFYPVDDADFGWTVGLGIADRDIVAPVFSLAWRLGLFGVGIVILALFFSRYLSHRITLDLRELTTSAIRIAEGRFGGRVAVRSRDEIGQLARAFNSMSAALAERDALIRDQQQRLLERARLEQELSIAAEVQQRLFPQFRPPLATLDYAGFCQPARGVSGDYYDFLPLAPAKLGLLLADVAGKGISAALLVASLHACVRTHAPLLVERCGDVLATVNSLLYEATHSADYATVFYAVYDDSARLLTYANAGHYPPMLVRADPLAVAVAASSAVVPSTAPVIRSEAPVILSPPRRAKDLSDMRPADDSEELGLNGRFRTLDFGTIPVGLFESLPAVQQSVQLNRGEWFVAYSDGLSEALNDREEEFGRGRLVDIVLQNPDRTADEMLATMLHSVQQHLGSRPPDDDLTLIVARVL